MTLIVFADVGEVIRTRHQQRRRTLSAGKKDYEAMKTGKMKGQTATMAAGGGGGDLLNITAQDLLGKSHEELVLLLIHLRRQSAGLAEAIETARMDLQATAEDAERSGREEGRRLLTEMQVSVTRRRARVSKS